MPSVIAAIGADNFASELLTAGRDSSQATHLSVFLFDANLEPRVVLTASSDGSAVAAEAGTEFIRRGLYRADPLKTAIARRPRDGGPMVELFSPRAASQESEHAAFYEMFDIAERLTILDRARLGWLSINFYRQATILAVPDEAIRDLVDHAAILHAMVARHLEIARASTPPRDTMDLLRRRMSGLDAKLTPRETDVCLLALHGATNGEIATALKVEASTVNTLRHRAYDRLGICNIVELFLKCLAVQD